MKYDLNRLKETIDREIPVPQPDEMQLHRAMLQAEKKQRFPAVRALTAAAACLLILSALCSLFAPALTIRPDDTGRRNMPLAQGGAYVPPRTEAPAPSPGPQIPADTAGAEENPDDYGYYDPMYAVNVFPTEAEFGDIVIRKIEHGYEKRFVFEEKATGETVFPGRGVDWHVQAFAYFPATDTALVGNGEGMALIRRDGSHVTDYIYTHFQYLTGGTAIAAEKNADETEPAPMHVADTASGARLSGEYGVIGTMSSDGLNLLMGHDHYDMLGDFDLLMPDGRLIARVSEFMNVCFGRWLAVRLAGEEYGCLIDLQGRRQLEDLRFYMILAQRDDYMIVSTPDGYGVIDQSGRWVFEPGRFVWIEAAGEDTFLVTEGPGEQKYVNRQGEDITGGFTRLAWKIRELTAEWLDSLGGCGRLIAAAWAAYLALRLLTSGDRRSFGQLLFAELGMAAYIAAVFLAYDRIDHGIAPLWPTDTSVAGAQGYAFGFALASFAALTALLHIFPKLRGPKRALMAAAALLLGPWCIKALAADMSVKDWRIMSTLTFLYLPAAGAALWAAFGKKRGERFCAWLARYDGMNEYSGGWRAVWYALAVAVLIGFAIGCFLSGQQMISFTHTVRSERGVQPALGLDEGWIDRVNDLRQEYADLTANGKEDEAKELLMSLYYDESMTPGSGAAAAAAVGWLEDKQLGALDAGMLLTLRAEGDIRLSRPFRHVQMWLTTGGSDYYTCAYEECPVSDDGHARTVKVLLLAPGEAEPETAACGWVAQHSLDFFASQRYYSIEGVAESP